LFESETKNTKRGRNEEIHHSGLDGPSMKGNDWPMEEGKRAAKDQTRTIVIANIFRASVKIRFVKEMLLNPG